MRREARVKGAGKWDRRARVEEERGRGEDRENRKYTGVIGTRVVLYNAIGFGPRAMREEEVEERVGRHYSGMEGEQVGDVWVRLYRMNDGPDSTA